MFGIGAGEFILILVVGLIVFGPSKLPEVGRSIGKALREFRKAQSALSNALSETEAQIVSAPKPASPQPVVENKTVEPQRTTVGDVTDMINAKPIAVPNDKLNLAKTDAVKES
ncbi:MAG: twin-arginine translocase TatA/TatE family subunit [Selenomonadaceae bacterium]|nr:twin-arginine translocase TatA/TatE family subunit [Selenomonadaceae bacterium]